MSLNVFYRHSIYLTPLIAARHRSTCKIVVRFCRALESVAGNRVKGTARRRNDITTWLLCVQGC